MSVSDVIELNLNLSIPEGTDEEIDTATRRLIRELKELDVESVQLLAGGESPEGTKGIDSVTIGSIAMSVLPSVLSPLRMVTFTTNLRWLSWVSVPANPP